MKYLGAEGRWKDRGCPASLSRTGQHQFANFPETSRGLFRNLSSFFSVSFPFFRFLAHRPSLVSVCFTRGPRRFFLHCGPKAGTPCGVERSRRLEDNEEALGLFVERGPRVQTQQHGPRAGVCSVSPKQGGREAESHTGSKYLESSGSRRRPVSTLTLGSEDHRRCDRRDGGHSLA